MVMVVVVVRGHAILSGAGAQTAAKQPASEEATRPPATLDGVRLMGPETMAAMIEVQTDRVDLLLGVAPMWGRGVTRNAVGVYGPRPHVFGHSGGAARSAAGTSRPRSRSAT